MRWNDAADSVVRIGVLLDILEAVQMAGRLLWFTERIPNFRELRAFTLWLYLCRCLHISSVTKYSDFHVWLEARDRIHCAHFESHARTFVSSWWAKGVAVWHRVKPKHADSNTSTTQKHHSHHRFHQLLQLGSLSRRIRSAQQQLAGKTEVLLLDPCMFKPFIARQRGSFNKGALQPIFGPDLQSNAPFS